MTLSPDNMNINKTLQDAFAKHIMAGNTQPVAVYLGSREERELLNDMAYFTTVQFAAVPMQIAGYPPRPKWAGLEVYRVNAESHIAFC